ncbi:unnamed protein product, partial [Discosporangium mesarthrocarpum]
VGGGCGWSQGRGLGGLRQHYGRRGGRIYPSGLVIVYTTKSVEVGLCLTCSPQCCSSFFFPLVCILVLPCGPHTLCILSPIFRQENVEGTTIVGTQGGCVGRGGRVKGEG